MMSDAQYDLTLALLSDDELRRWHRTILFGYGQAFEAGEDTGHLMKRLAEVGVERERRALEATGS